MLEKVKELENNLLSKKLIIETPLHLFNIEDISFINNEKVNVWLKLENLQSIGSYKVRGAGSVLLNEITNVDNGSSNTDSSNNGKNTFSRYIVTASAGNFAQGIVKICSELGFPSIIFVPDHAPNTKIEAIKRLDKITNLTNIVKVPFSVWWTIMKTETISKNVILEYCDDCLKEKFNQLLCNIKNEQLNLNMDDDIIEEQLRNVYQFISPVTHPLVKLGNSTIGLEVWNQFYSNFTNQNIDAILIPYGGGSMAIGIASIIRELEKINNKEKPIEIYAVEVDCACPLAFALKNGIDVEYKDFKPSWVDGIGSKGVFEDNFNKAKELLNGSLTVSLEEVASAVRLLVSRNRIIAEGAGACSVAVALKYSAVKSWRNVVCVVSGGNLEQQVLCDILQNKL
ncbi:hypothetical protein ABK040_016310 [Willaertia magna]